VLFIWVNGKQKKFKRIFSRFGGARISP